MIRILTLLTALSCVNCQAAEKFFDYWYIGGGILYGELSSNNAAFDDISGSGPHAVDFAQILT